MGTTFILNKILQNTAQPFEAIWAMTRALKASGWVKFASSDTTALEISNTASADKWGGTGSPATEVYTGAVPTAINAVSCWWGAVGPSLLWIPIGALPTVGPSTGSLLERGEKVTQATTLAEGEFLGIMYDTATPANSYMVVAPRVGTFAYTGSSVNDRITGANTGSYIAPAATIKTFVLEIVFWKAADQLTGSCYWGVFDTVAEAANRFSALASSAAGCTKTVAPGAGGTGNTFPALGALSIRGAGGTTNHGQWFNSSETLYGRYAVVAVDATAATGRSADPSFYCLIGVPQDLPTSLAGFHHQALNNAEEGDIAPYVFSWSSQFTGSASATTYKDQRTGYASNRNNWTDFGPNSNSFTSHWAFRRRGYASGDGVIGMSTFGLNTTSSGVCAMICGGSYYATIDQLSHHTQTVQSREDIWYGSQGTFYPAGVKTRKGTGRWSFFHGGGGLQNTWDTLSWVQVSLQATSSTPSISIGPWDGVTTPIF